MSKKIYEILNKPFVKNVIVVATGTASAQAVTMAFSPVITRLYGPETFGVLGVFMAMVGIISPLAALTYPTAIVLPKSDREAKGLMKISIYIACLIATLTSILLFLLNKQIVSLFKIEAIAPFLYLVPIVIVFAAFLQVAQQWLIRTKEFRVTAKVTFINAMILNSAKASVGLFYPIASVLVILSTLGSALNAIMLIIGTRSAKHNMFGNSMSLKLLRTIAEKYKDFPLFRAPQVFINAISQSLPILLLSSFFGPASAGLYSISRTVLIMPITLIGKSVGDVLYPRLTEAKEKDENFTRLIVIATLSLSAVGLIPFGTVVVFGSWLFEFVFGSEWSAAGDYAKWLALWLFFRFVSRPSIIAIPILNLQGRFLVYEIVSISLNIASLFIGFLLYKNDEIAIALSSLTGVIMYVFLIIWILRKSRIKEC